MKALLKIVCPLALSLLTSWVIYIAAHSVAARNCRSRPGALICFTTSLALTLPHQNVFSPQPSPVLRTPSPAPAGEGQAEREQSLSIFWLLDDASAISAARHFENAANDSPSPGGEGRDEGER